MWIHLNRVRSTFSKSAADTSGRFLSHRMEGQRRRGMAKWASARISNGLLGPLRLALFAAWQEAGSAAQASEAQLQDRPCPRLNTQLLLAPFGFIQTGNSLLGYPYLYLRM